MRMGAFLGYDDVGVWASNAERDAFLDWFAAHRCAPGERRWEFCKSARNRWMGCCIELSALIPRGMTFAVTPAEQASAAEEFWPDVGTLLGIVSQITRGEWTHLVGSEEAIGWRPGAERQAARQKEQEELLRQPFRSSSFGPDEQVRFLPLDDGAEK
jgi:hypothetical protein